MFLSVSVILVICKTAELRRLMLAPRQRGRFWVRSVPPENSGGLPDSRLVWTDYLPKWSYSVMVRCNLNVTDWIGVPLILTWNPVVWKEQWWNIEQNPLIANESELTGKVYKKAWKRCWCRLLSRDFIHSFSLFLLFCAKQHTQLQPADNHSPPPSFLSEVCGLPHFQLLVSLPHFRLSGSLFLVLTDVFMFCGCWYCRYGLNFPKCPKRELF